jgi:hypothetical protein
MTTETICPICGHDVSESGEQFGHCPECGYQWNTMVTYTEGRKPKRAPKKRLGGTDYQRAVFIDLFNGGKIAKYGSRYRLWDKRMHPLRRFRISTFLQVKKLCRLYKGFWYIDRKKVRALRRNTWVKKYYLTLKKKS